MGYGLGKHGGIHHHILLCGSCDSYVSSLTVEKMSIWLYGYPSAFIMGNPSFFNKMRTGDYWKDFIPRKRGSPPFGKELPKYFGNYLLVL